MGTRSLIALQNTEGVSMIPNIKRDYIKRDYITRGTNTRADNIAIFIFILTACVLAYFTI